MAQSLHHAALVVDFGDGRVLVRVVPFAEETISGVDLLRRSGLDVAIMENLGGGAALCAVEGVGCPPTPQDCFCQCRGGTCRYWSYFHLQGGAWTYAGTGAAGRALRDGDVDGWVWGDGRTAPPLLTWEEIWARSGAQPTLAPPPLPPASATPVPPTATPSRPTAAPATASPPPATVPPSARPAATAAPPPSAWPTARLPTAPPPPRQETAAPTTSPTATPPPVAPPPGSAAGGFSPGAALAFAGLVLAFLALGLWVRRRKRV